MTEENSLGWYIKQQVEPLLVPVKNKKTINTEGIINPTVCKKNESRRIFNSWKDKIMHGQYLRD